jgi:hypothetical protein
MIFEGQKSMRCPVCKAMVEQHPQCRRCRADLSLLFAVERQAQVAGEEAVRLAGQGRDVEALHLAGRAAALHSTKETQRFLAVLHLRGRDFAAAWAAYQSYAGERAADES